MEHLISFNESKVDDICKEIENIGEQSLAYLKDEGFIFQVERSSVDEHELFINIDGTKPMVFKDVLPDLLPFLELIQDKLLLIEIGVSLYHKQHNFTSRYTLTVDELEKLSTMDENYEANWEILTVASFTIYSRIKKIGPLARVKRFFRSFNESKTDDLELFCNTNLAYLLDEGYEIFYEHSDRVYDFTKVEQPEATYSTISITIPSDISEGDGEDYDAGEYEWSDINDDLIPFLELLKSKYTINDEIEFFTNEYGSNYKYYTIDELIDDIPLELNCQIYQICLKVS